MIEKYLKYLYNNVALKSEERLMDLLDGPVDSLLDLGCWDGKNTICYGKKACAKKLFGIEIEKSKAKIASENGVMVKISDLNSKLPFEDNSMDAAVANHVIEHLTQTGLFLSEIHRVLKKGGYAIIATPNLASWHNIFALIFGIQPFSGPHAGIIDNGIKSISRMDKYKTRRILKSTHEGYDCLRHLVVMTYKELIRNLRKAGFAIEKSYGFGYYPLPAFLAKLLSKADISHSHYILLKAVKK